MVKVEIKAEKRKELGKKLKKIRAKGIIPAVVYGRRIKSASIAVDSKEYIKKVIQSEAGLNLIFILKMEEDGKSTPIPVITYRIQKDPLTDKIIHVDFMNVIMDEVIKTKVPVELHGIPIGVKESDGVLVHGLREIEIKCLPGDIPDKFDLDVSGLNIGNSFHVSDIKVSQKIEILASGSEMVAIVSAPTKIEEVAPAALTPEAAAAAEAEAAPAVAEEQVKEKSAPGAAPAKEKGAAPAK